MISVTNSPASLPLLKTKQGDAYAPPTSIHPASPIPQKNPPNPTTPFGQLPINYSTPLPPLHTPSSSPSTSELSSASSPAPQASPSAPPFHSDQLLGAVGQSHSSTCTLPAALRLRASWGGRIWADGSWWESGIASHVPRLRVCGEAWHFRLRVLRCGWWWRRVKFRRCLRGL